MPVETVAWLGANVLVGLLTLAVALYVTRKPEMTDGVASAHSDDRDSDGTGRRGPDAP